MRQVLITGILLCPIFISGCMPSYHKYSPLISSTATVEDFKLEIQPLHDYHGFMFLEFSVQNNSSRNIAFNFVSMRDKNFTYPREPIYPSTRESAVNIARQLIILNLKGSIEMSSKPYSSYEVKDGYFGTTIQPSTGEQLGRAWSSASREADYNFLKNMEKKIYLNYPGYLPISIKPDSTKLFILLFCFPIEPEKPFTAIFEIDDKVLNVDF